MFLNHTKAERYCPKTEIKDRIHIPYGVRIRPLIYILVLNLTWPSLQTTLGTVPILSLSLALTTYQTSTFADFFDEFEEIDEDGQVENPENSENYEESEDQNKVLDQIDLDEWDITLPHDNLPTDAVYGVLYDRYSSDNQEESGCIARVKAMLDKMEDMDVPLYRNPIVDIAETGKDIDRDGLEEIVRLVQHPQVSYFFVHDVDRIARWNSFCIFLLDVFTREFDVTIVTDQGELELDRLEGLATTWVSSMAAEIENRNKAKRTLQGQLENFADGSYETFYRDVKIGYAESKDQLVEIDQDQVEIARATFNTFDRADEDRPYDETINRINGQYGGLLDKPLNYYRLKVMLKDPIYIGKPTASGESIGDQGQEKVLDKPHLQLINRELFERVNNKIERVGKANSNTSSPGDVMNLEYLLFEFGFIPLVESSARVAVICPECDSKMVRDGKNEMQDPKRKAVVYKCQDCENDGEVEGGSYKTFPNTLEFYKIKLFERVIENIDKVSSVLDLKEI